MSKTLLRLIGLYELLTGGFGTLFLVYSVLLAGGGSLIALIFLAMYALTALAGLWLWSNRPAGIRLSIISQAAQTLSVSAGSIAYLFTAGIALWVRLGRGGLDFDHDFGTRFRLGIVTGFGPGSSPYPYSIGINLLPLAILLYLWFGARTKSGKR